MLIADGYKKNPAAAMRRVKADPVPTDYFPPEEIEKILEATKQYRDPDYEEVHNHATRLRILVLLMRWSGLRISDAVTLGRTRLVGNNVFLYQAIGCTVVSVGGNSRLRSRRAASQEHQPLLKSASTRATSSTRCAAALVHPGMSAAIGAGCRDGDVWRCVDVERCAASWRV